MSSIVYVGKSALRVEVEGADDPGDPKAVVHIMKYLFLSKTCPGFVNSLKRLKDE
jgi:hypothetical protein